MKDLVRNCLVSISLMFLASYLFSCLPESNFSMEYISPQYGSPDVPLNAVIKVVFLSKEEIDEDYLSQEKFSLSKITQKDNSKDAGKTGSDSTQSSSLEQSQTNQELTEIKCIMTYDSKKVPVTGPNGEEMKYRTFVYLVPVPELKKRTPLLPSQKYMLSIAELRAGSDTYGGYTLIFTTKDSGFSFVDDKNELAAAKLLSNTNLKQDEPLIIDLPKPINPFKLQKYSKLEAIEHCPEQVSGKDSLKEQIEEKGAKLAENADEQLNKDLLAYSKMSGAMQKKYKKEKETKLKELEQKESPTDADAEQQAYLEALIDLIGTGLADNDIDKNEQETGCSKIDLKDRTSANFTISFLEDFSQKDGEKFVKASYKKLMIMPTLDPDYKYQLALSVKGGKNTNTEYFKRFDGIRVQREAIPDEQQNIGKYTGGLREINFFETGEDE